MRRVPDDVSRTSRCIFRNVAAFLVVLLAGVVAVTAVPGAQDKIEEKDWILSLAIWLFVATFLALLVVRFSNPSKAWRVGTVAAFGISLAFMLTVSSAYGDPAAALMALAATFVLFGALAVIGLRSPLGKGKIAALALPLLLTLLGVIVVMVVNIFLGIAWLDVCIWLAVLVLFSFFTYYDVSLFARHCRGEDCCLDGTVNLWLDFANMFSALRGLS